MPRASRVRNKEYVDGVKRSRGCYFCRESHPEALEWHHLKSDEPDAQRVSSLISRGASLVRIKEEMDRCLILCRSCHAKLHHVLKRSTR